MRTCRLQFLLCFSASILVACPADEVAPVVTESGIMGETCEKWSDCGEGLACIDSRCVIEVFPVSPNANVCEYQECTIPEQCCDLSAFDCDGYLASCSQGSSQACTDYRSHCTCSVTTQRCEEGRCAFHCKSAQDCCPSLNINFCFDLQQKCDLGDATACQNYVNVGCSCDPAKFACSTEGQCQSACEEDAECPAGVCQNGMCVPCREDGDCPINQKCFGFACVETCTNNSSCPAFHICDVVTGACVSNGCFTDRECIAYTSNVLATCKAGACEVPCETDIDCDDPFNFGHMTCENNVCTYIGCETDEECKILNPNLGDGTGEWKCVGSGAGVPF